MSNFKLDYDKSELETKDSNWVSRVLFRHDFLTLDLCG